MGMVGKMMGMIVHDPMSAYLKGKLDEFGIEVEEIFPPDCDEDCAKN